MPGRRFFRFFRYGAIVSMGLVLLVLGLLGGVNLPSVRHLAERKLPGWTGGMVQVEGLGIILPWHLALSHVVLRDPQGIWLEGRQADLCLGLSGLLHRQVHIRSLSATELDYIRNPSFPSDQEAGKTGTGKQGSGASSLPDWAIRVDSLRLDRLSVGSALFGQSARLQLQGRAFLGSWKAFTSLPSFRNMSRTDLTLRADRLDSPAHLRVDLHAGRHKAGGMLHYDEAAPGFASSPGLLGLLDPLMVDLSFHGPYEALVTALHVRAGGEADQPLNAEVKGGLDLVHWRDDLSLYVHAPAMAPGPDLGWTALELQAALHGPMLDPKGIVQLDGTDVMVAGAGAGQVHVHLDGRQGGLQAVLAQKGAGPAGLEGAGPGNDAGALHLSARLDGVSLPAGKASSVLAGAPLRLEAMMQPYRSDRPYELHLRHEAIRLDIAGHVSAALSAHAKLDVAALPGRLSALLGQKLAGMAHVEGDFNLPLSQEEDMTAILDGRFGLGAGPARVVAMVGRQGALHVRMIRHADGIMQLEEAMLAGRAFRLDGKALLDRRQSLSAALKLSLPELAAVHPALRGHALLESAVQGPLGDMALKTHMTGMLGVVHPGMTLPAAPLEMTADLAHLPSRSQGTLKLDGVLDRSPVTLHLALARQGNGSMSVELDRLSWKNLKGRASLGLPAGQYVPHGDVKLNLARLDDFSHLLGRPMSGHLRLGMHTAPGPGRAGRMVAHNRLELMMEGQFRMRGYALDRLRLQGEIQHLLDDPVALVTFQLSGLRAQEMTGGMEVLVKGPQKALAVQGHGTFEHVMQAPARFSLAALADLPGERVRLDGLFAELKGDGVRLTGPAVLHYGRILALDHLSADMRSPRGAAGHVFINGTFKPKLDLEARLEHVAPALVEPFVPALHVAGELGGEARLRGSLSAPEGRVALDGSGLRVMNGATDSLPPGRLHLQADMDGRQALLQSELRAGDPLGLLLSGRVPFSSTGTLDLSARGRMDLSVANAFLGSDGMATSGQLGLDLAMQGSVRQPRLAGTVQLHDGSFDHYGVGGHLSGVDALVTAHGDTLDIDHVTAHAGRGTLGLSGKVGVLHPGLPVDLRFMMRKAQPVQSDLLNEVIDSQLHIHGQATTRLDVAGTVTVPEASITLPDSLPASVPQLEIITPDSLKARPRPAASLLIGLDIGFTAPEKLFVRGHGLFAEMQGRLHVGGMASAPVVTGGINLKRGNFNLAGINLNFTHGQIGFDGTSAAHKLDPTVDFRADRNADGTLASLLVRGYASEPKIDFVSTPSLPRDEVLSILLFGAHRSSLSPAQLASLGLAVVQIGGGSAFDPLGKVRSTLGLDHLAIGGGNSVGNGGASLEAGKYVMKGVYVGAREGLSGGGTQAQVKVDLTKRLQLNTTVGTGGQVTGFTTPENDPGSSIGLSYGMDY